jgi:hypothetical protein
LTVLGHAAHLHDGSMAELVLSKLKEDLHGIKLIFADVGYRVELIEGVKQKLGFMMQIMMRKDQDHFQILPKRWIVERTFAWFDNYR